MHKGGWSFTADSVQQLTNIVLKTTTTIGGPVIHKAMPTAAMWNIAIAIQWTATACAPLRHLSLVQANPLGAATGGLSKSHGERSQNLKFHNNPNTTKRDNNSWAFASPVYTRYPLMLQLGGPLPQLTPGHQVPG